MCLLYRVSIFIKSENTTVLRSEVGCQLDVESILFTYDREHFYMQCDCENLHLEIAKS